jgi:hypothetical protein
VRLLEEPEYGKLEALSQAEDEPKSVVEQLGCRPLYDTGIGDLLNGAIVQHRVGSLSVLLGAIAYGSPEERDRVLGGHLSVALQHSEFAAADVLLGKIGTVPNYDTLWQPPAKPWDLERMKLFVERHPGRLAELVPRYPNVGILRKAEDVIVLIDLAVHCHARSVREGGRRLFDADYFMYELLQPSTALADADKAAVARRLLEAGANPFAQGWEAGLAGRPDLAQTYAAVQARRAEAEARRLELEAAILAGDDAVALAGRLEGYVLPYDVPTRALLDLAIQHRRLGALRVLLALLDFKEQAAKDAALGTHLSAALQHGSLGAADALLDQMTSVPNWASLWQPPRGDAQPWDLRGLKAFLERHRGRVQDLVPRYQNLALMRHPRDALVLIALARHCDAALRPHPDIALFDPTWFLYQLLVPETAMADADKAVVARRLLVVGADRNYGLAYCGGHPAGLALTCAAIGAAQAPAAAQPGAAVRPEASRTASGAPITTTQR